MDGILINALIEVVGTANPALIVWGSYLLLKATREIHEHDKRISKLEWENDNG